MGRLAGKIAVVTAAAQGIGRATALAFAAKGAKVYATDIARDKLLQLTSPGIETAELDVRDSAAVAKFASHLGNCDVLFNCVGIVHHGTILDCDERSWDLSFDSNIKSMYRTIRCFLPAMIQQGGGSIINVSSVASSVIGVPNRFVTAPQRRR